jgi:DNA-binding YbaB/EbfC family protein
MLKEIGQLAGLLKQAQGLSGRMQEVQGKLAALRCVGRAGDGLVTVELNGQGRAVDCSLHDSLLHPSQQARLQTLLLEAFNDAQQQVRRSAANEISQLTGGFNLPGLSDALTGFANGGRAP